MNLIHKITLYNHNKNIKENMYNYLIKDSKNIDNFNIDHFKNFHFGS
jgi:hypothetical protein